MARRVRGWFRELPEDTHEILAQTGKRGLTSTASLRELERREATVITPLKDIVRMARAMSKKYRVPIRIATEKFRTHSHADAFVREVDGKSVIFLHPVLQYYSPKYVREVILHEIDHYKVFKRTGGR